MSAIPSHLWQKHLDELDEHYHPDKFFIEQSMRPTNEPHVHEHFFTPAIIEETETAEEAKLSVDVLQDEKNLYVIAPLAGVDPKRLEVILEKDILTIRGERYYNDAYTEKNSLYQECYWGKFSRSIILPVPVQNKGLEANLSQGILTVSLPKAEEKERVEITVETEK